MAISLSAPALSLTCWPQSARAITPVSRQRLFIHLFFASIGVSTVRQALYEAGYITYMRTDRPILSKAAVCVAEQAVRDSFGEEYLRIGKKAFLSPTFFGADVADGSNLEFFHRWTISHPVTVFVDGSM